MEEDIREDVNNVGENGFVTFFKIILKLILGFWIEIIIFSEVIVTFGLNWVLTKFNVKTLAELITQCMDPLKLIEFADMLKPEMLVDAGYNILLKSVALWVILNILYYMISRFLKAKTLLKVELILAVMIGLGIYTCLSVDLAGAIETLENLDTTKIENYSDIMNAVSENPEVLQNIDVGEIFTEDGQINSAAVEEIMQNEELMQEVMNVLENEEIRNDLSTILENEGIDPSVLDVITEENLNSGFLNSGTVDINSININTNSINPNNINMNTINSDIFNTINSQEYDINKINNVINDYNLNIDNINFNTIYCY